MTNDNDVIANMLNAAPVCGSVWDREGRSVVCNDAALRFFGLASKQTWQDHYAELSPACQLGGEASGPLLLAHLRKAFAEGRTEFSWQHCRLDGQIIPAQVSLTRVYQGGDEWVVAYATLQPAQVPHHTIDNRDDGPMRVEFVSDLHEQTREQAEKHEAAERQRIMFDAAAASITFWSWDDELKLIDCNQEAANFFELGSKQEYIDHFFELSPEYQPCGRLSSELAVEYISTAFREGRAHFEWLHRKLDGELVPAQITLVRALHGDRNVVVGHTLDLREVRKFEYEKREADEYTQIMLDAMPLCCTLWNEAHEIMACNQEAVHLFGLSSKQDYLDRFFDLSPEYQPSGSRSRELLHEHLSTAFREGHVRLEWMNQTLDGEPVPTEITMVRVSRGDGYIVVSYNRDLRELKETVAGYKRLKMLAYTDKLTGVANRHHFLEKAAAQLDSLSVGSSASLLLLDVDHFKEINDTHGHSTGDLVLRLVAERVRKTLRPKDLFARYGGEEFVILLGRADLESGLAVAERVRKAIAQAPFESRGKRIVVTMSIGVAVCGYPASPLQELTDRADVALYQAKHRGRNRVEHIPAN